jgi:hypothetical protein
MTITTTVKTTTATIGTTMTAVLTPSCESAGVIAAVDVCVLVSGGVGVIDSLDVGVPVASGVELMGSDGGADAVS